LPPTADKQEVRQAKIIVSLILVLILALQRKKFEQENEDDNEEDSGRPRSGIYLSCRREIGRICE
jgi:hypothetical protein